MAAAAEQEIEVASAVNEQLGQMTLESATAVAGPSAATSKQDPVGDDTQAGLHESQDGRSHHDDEEDEDGDEGGVEGDEVIRPPSPASITAPSELPAATMEGYLLKKCRRNGDERPWKRRYFVLVQGSLLYHHMASKEDPPRLFVHLSGVTLLPCEAPSGRGIGFRLPDRRIFGLAVEGGAALHDAWWQQLEVARSLPIVLVPDVDDSHATLSSLGKMRSALASAFATSRLGRLLIKRYLDEAARVLIHTVVDFVRVERGDRLASRLEGYIFDIAARIAVIVHANALPPGVDKLALYDRTLDFCQGFVHFARDRRLAAERRAVANASVAPVNLELLVDSISYVAAAWRGILLPNVSTRVVDRYDFVIDSLFSRDQLSAIFEKESHRERMAIVERSLRTLLETY